MDIADIRNKAKAEQQKVDNKVPAPDEGVRSAVELDVAEVEDAVDDSQQVQPAPHPATSADSELGPEMDSSTTALDQLFGADSRIELATEEAYEDALLLQETDAHLETNQYLSFQLGDEEYALDITQISEIIKVRELTEIPRVPLFILGIISLRGVVVPVFDLRRRFQLGEAELTSASRIIVCLVGEVVAGLLVDTINQVISINKSHMEPPPAVLSGIDRELVEGVGRYQGRMVILLKLQSVLDVDLI